MIPHTAEAESYAGMFARMSQRIDDLQKQVTGLRSRVKKLEGPVPDKNFIASNKACSNQRRPKKGA